MTIGYYMTICVAFALALAKVGSGHRMHAIVDAGGAMNNLRNHSGSGSHLASVSTHGDIMPAMHNDTEHRSVQNMSNWSFVTADVTYSRSNMPTASAFIENGQGALSAWMLHSRKHPQGIAKNFLCTSLGFMLLLLVLYCLSLTANVVLQTERADEPMEDDEPSASHLSDSSTSQAGCSRVGQRHKFKRWMNRFVTYANDHASLGDRETADDRLARSVSEGHSLGKAKYANLKTSY